MRLDDENLVVVSSIPITDSDGEIEAQTAKRYPVEESAYKTSFVKCLTVVYENEQYLFNDHEIACISHYLFELSDNARYLFARLFLRSQRKWFRESDYIQYDRDCDIRQAVEDLSIPYNYTTEDDASEVLPTQFRAVKSEAFLLKYDYNQSLTNTLELLNLAELRTLTSKFKISMSKKAPASGATAKSTSKSRAELIKDLAKIATQAPLSSFFKPTNPKGKTVSSPSAGNLNNTSKDKVVAEARLLLGTNVIRLNPFVYKTISRAFTVYFRMKEFETNFVECALLKEMSLNNFPTYPVKRDSHFFSSRTECLEYEEALVLKYDTEALIAGKSTDRRKKHALDLFHKIESRLVSALQAAAYSSSFHEEEIEDSVTQSIVFTPEWVGIKAALMLCTGLFGDCVSEWKFLDLFLNQRVYHRDHRGKAYIRKALLEMNQISSNLELAQELSGFSTDNSDQFTETLITAYQQFNPTSTLPKRQRNGKPKKSTPPDDKQESENLITGEDNFTSGLKLFWARRALATCVQGLEDASVHEVFHIDLKKRIARLERQLKVPMSSRHDFSHFLLKPAISRTIECERVMDSDSEVSIQYPSKSGYFQNQKNNLPSTTVVVKNNNNLFKRPMFVDIEGKRDSVNVEEASLSYYRTFGWEGVHSENSMLATLFALLFWDILFAPIICPSTNKPKAGIFEHHCQTFPLDLFSKMFYSNRKDAIDARLEAIRTDFESVKKQFIKVYQRESPRQTLCVGLAWYPLEALLTILEGLGSKATAIICEQLAKNYRVLKSGMPDLCLWKVATRQCMFSEVKSEHDTLSDKQCYWIDILVNAGVAVEVCHVLEPKSYFKKMKLNGS